MIATFVSTPCTNRVDLAHWRTWTPNSA